MLNANNNNNLYICCMTIDEFISTIEDVYLEECLERLARNPKDMIAIYLSAKEFERAKLMRGNAVPIAQTEEERNILVHIKE